MLWGGDNPAESKEKAWGVLVPTQEEYWCFGTNYFRNTGLLGTGWVTPRPHRLPVFYISAKDLRDKWL